MIGRGGPATASPTPLTSTMSSRTTAWRGGVRRGSFSTRGRLARPRPPGPLPSERARRGADLTPAGVGLKCPGRAPDPRQDPTGFANSFRPGATSAPSAAGTAASGGSGRRAAASFGTTVSIPAPVPLSILRMGSGPRTIRWASCSSATLASTFWMAVCVNPVTSTRIGRAARRWASARARMATATMWGLPVPGGPQTSWRLWSTMPAMASDWDGGTPAVLAMSTAADRRSGRSVIGCRQLAGLFSRSTNHGWAWASGRPNSAISGSLSQSGGAPG